MKKETIHEFFRRLEGENPSPSSELIYYSPYTLLISVVLSAQATDEGVNKATPKLFEEADNPKKMVNLGEARIRELIKSIGLFNTKAKNIISLRFFLFLGQLATKSAHDEFTPWKIPYYCLYAFFK